MKLKISKYFRYSCSTDGGQNKKRMHLGIYLYIYLYIYNIYNIVIIIYTSFDLYII